MLTILTAPLRALIGFVTLISMIISAITLYLLINNEYYPLLHPIPPTINLRSTPNSLHSNPRKNVPLP